MTSNPVFRERSHCTNRRKIFLAMKITTILLFSACLTASAGGLAQNVTLSVKNEKLEKVFKEIKKQTGYVFFYDTRVLQGAKRVSVYVKNESIEEVLKESLQGQPLDFSIERKTITIFQKAGYALNRMQANFATPVVAVLPPVPVSIINGTVKDSQGNPLGNVSVIVKGTQRGTSTGADGGFSIEANVGDVL
ncbi:MAG TPA: secretin and TonB N-terminal domain-containing protein, partial [Chitinophagaceae bacterium]